MSRELVEKLREIIDQKHRRAIEALETIEAYLDEVPAKTNGSVSDSTQKDQPSLLAQQAKAALDARSIRHRVLDCIEGPGFTSVDTILATNPTLDKKQIWGVITAPDLKDRIERVTTQEGTAYRLKPKID